MKKLMENFNKFVKEEEVMQEQESEEMGGDELDANRMDFLKDNEKYIISTIHAYLKDIHDSLSRNRIQLKPEELVDFVQKALESFTESREHERMS